MVLYDIVSETAPECLFGFICCGAGGAGVGDCARRRVAGEVFEDGVADVLVEDLDCAVEIRVCAGGWVGCSVDAEAPVVVVTAGVAGEFVAVGVGVACAFVCWWFASFAEIGGCWWFWGFLDHGVRGRLGCVRPMVMRLALRSLGVRCWCVVILQRDPWAPSLVIQVLESGKRS